MARIEEVMPLDGDWGGIEQITPQTRLGYAQNFLFVETLKAGGDANNPADYGVYNLPHVPADRMADFLAWLANL